MNNKKIGRIGLMLGIIGWIAEAFLNGNLAFSGEIEPELITEAQEKGEVRVIVYLKNQPFYEIAQEKKMKHIPQIKLLQEGVRGIMERYPPRLGTTATGKIIIEDTLPLSEKEQVREKLFQVENFLSLMRKEIIEKTQDAVREEQQDLQEFIETIGGEVIEKIAVGNAVSAIIPSNKLQDLAALPNVAYPFNS